MWPGSGKRPHEQRLANRRRCHLHATVFAISLCIWASIPASGSEEKSDHAEEKTSHAAESLEEMTERPARSSGRDIKIPKALVAQLESEYYAFLKKNDASSKVQIKRKFLNISAELTQKHPIALHENTRVVAPLGGGVIDLAEFVTPLKGAFQLKILSKKEDGSEPSGLRMFFVSKAKTRRLEGDDYGAGCGKYMEITSYYHHKLAKGFDLYTAGQRYLSVVGGTFVAAVFEKEALQVASLTFTDSRYPDLTCE